ncbi:DUF6049 family protein [Stomatohabitans albus]|uniref:DUF6049 family protein n=1 Tax=Stomatohabitans albus TaxID=3110766 RepID=UPI00300C8919
MSGVIRWFGACLLALLSGFVATPFAIAQSVPASPRQTPTPPTSATTDRLITIESINGILSPSQPLQLRLAIGQGKPLANPRITLAVREPATSREDLQQAVLNQETGWLFSSSAESLTPLGEGESRSVLIERSTTDLYLDRFEATGVYPLEITLLDGNHRVARLVTALVVDPQLNPVPLAIVGSLGQTEQSVVVGSHDDMPTLAREVIPTPAYDADLFSLAETNQFDLIDRTVSEGLSDRLATDSVSVAPVIASPTTINRSTASAISRTAAVDGILVPEGTLTQAGSVHRFNAVKILAGDPAFKKAAAVLDGPALGQWAIAYAALPQRLQPTTPIDTDAEQTNPSSDDGETIQSPLLLDLRSIPSAEDQRVLQETLATAPWVRLGGVGDLMNAPADVITPTAFSSPVLSQQRRDYFARLKAARDALPGIVAMTERRSFEDGTSPLNFDDELLVATAVNEDESQAATRVLNTKAQIEGGIQVLSPPPITMTGQRGTIPISVANDSPIGLTVRVRIISSNLKIEGNDTVDMRLRPRDATAKDIVVSPRTSGGITSAIVQVENPQTGQLITSGTISVRSTAYPVTALLFAAGAIGILVLWGWRNRSANRIFRRTARPVSGPLPSLDETIPFQTIKSEPSPSEDQ